VAAGLQRPSRQEVGVMMYILAWLLGVPATILILIWLINRG
jgi:hypothetical protein